MKRCHITSNAEKVYLVLFHDNPHPLLKKTLIEIVDKKSLLPNSATR